ISPHDSVFIFIDNDSNGVTPSNQIPLDIIANLCRASSRTTSEFNLDILSRISSRSPLVRVSSLHNIFLIVGSKNFSLNVSGLLFLNFWITDSTDGREETDF